MLVIKCASKKVYERFEMLITTTENSVKVTAKDIERGTRPFELKGEGIQ